ncbi:MAG: ATP-binding cassette domain-containing protein [Defluviitaleaceae bacterium]|nr:ATP-binding cassette domain-containing protein [Defluviitaleaceae bacterium]
MKDNTTKLETSVLQESKPKILYLIKFWLFNFKSIKLASILYLSTVVILAVLRPVLALTWRTYVLYSQENNFLYAILFLFLFFSLSYISETIIKYTETSNTIERLDIVYANRLRETTLVRLFTKLSRITSEILEIPKINDKISHIFSSIANPYFGLSDTVIRQGYLIIGKIISIFSIGISLYIFNYYLLILVIIAPIPILFTTLYSNKKSFQFTKESVLLQRKMQYLQNLMIKSSAKELYVYSAHNFIYEKWQKLSLEYTKKEKYLYRKGAFIQAINSLIINIINISGYIISIIFLANGILTIYSVAAVISLYQSLLSDIVIFISGTSSIISKKFDASVFNDFVNLPETKMTTEALDINEIEVKNVYYRYPNTPNYVLNDINIKIKKGEKIAIVGENGSGKSTFVSILSGLLAPSAGSILVNGKDTNDDILKSTSIISQQPAKYESFTIEDNIYLGNIDKEKNSSFIDNALMFAKIDVDKTQVLGKIHGGTDLSGGEWQKLAIARAVYRDKNFIILDEPTGNLDPIVESQILNSYINLTKDKTLIFITHRIKSTSIADRIIVFEKGCIVQDLSADEYNTASGQFGVLRDKQEKN